MKGKRIIRPPEGTQAPARSQYSELVDIDRSINNGLTNATGTFLISILGAPMSSSVVNMTHTVDVGPFKASGLDPATNSLKEIMFVVQNEYPELYKRLSNDGMRVVRNIAGSKSYSLHSWGLAIDIRIDNVKDVRFNDKALYGLTLIAPVFHRCGWYWGGGFRDKETRKGSNVYWSNEDAMHFEVSKEKLLEWQRSGMFGPISEHRQETILPANHNTTSPLPTALDIRKGHKGPCVVLLQKALRERHYNITADGRFGTKTELALVDFQHKHGLIANGIVGVKTAQYLSLPLFAGR